MIYSLPHKKLGMVATTALIGFFVVSCGSYQQASYYDNDGIYSSGNQRVTEGNYSKSQPQTQQQSNTYGEYFSEKANQYQDVLDSEIFTDVDSYYGGSDQDSIAPVSQGNYYASNNDYNGYGGWGDNPTSVNVNIYSGGYGGMGYGYYNPWAWGYGGYWGGYSPWYSPWYGGYYGGYYGGGYWGGGYWYGGYPGWAWGGGWYGPSYPYYPYYGYSNRQYGYTSGRRGYYNNNYLTANTARRSNSTALNSRTTNSRYRSNASSTARRTTDYRSSTTARRSVGVDAAAQNRSYRTSRSTRAVPTYSSSNGNQTISRRSTYSNSNGNTSGRTYRSSAPSSNSRSSSVSPSSNRSSGNTSARSSSSGSYRSSGSSGAVRSSSGSSGGGSRRN